MARAHEREAEDGDVHGRGRERHALDVARDDAGDLLKIAKAYARWRTRADVEAAPLAPAPKRKRKPAAPAPAAAPAEAPPAKKQAASELLDSYGAYAAYGAE